MELELVDELSKIGVLGSGGKVTLLGGKACSRACWKGSVQG